MRKDCVILLICLSLASCDVASLSDIGRPRCVVMGNPSSLAEQEKEGYAELGVPGLYMSAIEVMDGYDWKCDTACGNASCKALLYRDGKLVLSFPTGFEHHVGTDPDTFHLSGGHLYSEYSDGAWTYVLKDGLELFSYSGREYLKGLLVRGDDVYTLGAARSGCGFSYRKNGTPLLSSEDGDVIGGFDGFLSERSGALYEDGDRICFQYRTSGGDRMLVSDGEVLPVTAPKSANRFAFRCVGGETVYMSVSATLSYSISLSGEMRIGRLTSPVDNLEAGSMGGSVLFLLSGEENCFVKTEKMENLISVPFPSAAFYADGDDLLAVSMASDGSMSVWDSGGSLWSISPHYSFTNDCACFSGGSLYIAGTPHGNGGETVIYKDGRRYMKYGLDGFATGLELVVSPPS